MAGVPDNERRRPLVTVGSHTETDIATGKTERQLFVKMYFEARDSGLLAAIPDRLWKMLCVLATYIDENGNCYPSQTRIAEDLGIARETVNRILKELLAFRFQGSPVVAVAKVRLDTPAGSRWANNVYQLHPISGFQIFDQPPKTDGLSAPRPSRASAYVTESSHRPVSGNRHTGTRQKRHTNQNHVFNQTHAGVSSSTKRRTAPASAGALVQHFHQAARHPADQEPLEKEFKQAAELIAEHGDETARWIVDFALQRADETNFRPRHLGAVLSYVSEALNARERHVEKRRRRVEDAHAAREHERELAAQRAAYDALPPDEKVKRDLERWILFFPPTHKNRQPTSIEIEEKRRDLEREHGCDNGKLKSSA